MFTVSVEKECGCFRKSGLVNNKSFDNKDDAMIHALNMTKEMNQDFCQKHEFSFQEAGDSFMISVNERTKSSCCGGGHCG